MPAKKKSEEEILFDLISKSMYKGTLAQAKKQFTFKLFREWLKDNQETVSELTAPPISNEKEILNLISEIIISKQKLTLSEILSEIKQKTTIKTITKLKPFIKKLVFPPTTTFEYPKKLIGKSILKINRKTIEKSNFLDQLQNAYRSIEHKMGKMVEIPVLAEKINQTTGIPIDEIYHEIYLAYLDKKVDLQPGKAMKGKPIKTEDGSALYWFQFR